MADLAKQIFWDYNMTDAKMRRMLKSGTEWEKHWVASRILERAPFDKVWQFLTLKQVQEMFPILKFRPQMKEIWAKALRAWGVYEKNSQQNKSSTNTISV